MDERAKIAAQRSPIVIVHKSLKELHPSFYAKPDVNSEVFEEPERNALSSEPVGELRIWETPEYTTESHDPMHSLTKSGEFGSPAQPAVEHSIRRLPPIAQAKVEEVRARAELQYRSDAQNPNKNMDEPVAEYVRAVFFQYLAQARNAADEECWTAEELRCSVQAQLRNEIESGFNSKHPVGLKPAIADSKAAIFSSYDPRLLAYMPTAKDMKASFRADLMDTITNDPVWEEYLNQLQSIAASQIDQAIFEAKPTRNLARTQFATAARNEYKETDAVISQPIDRLPSPVPTLADIQAALDSGDRKRAIEFWQNLQKNSSKPNSKQALANKAGQHRSELNKWENGKLPDGCRADQDIRKALLSL